MLNWLSEGFGFGKQALALSTEKERKGRLILKRLKRLKKVVDHTEEHYARLDDFLDVVEKTITDKELQEQIKYLRVDQNRFIKLT